ncbi:hypothetical protein Nepgr_027533 [Nepenthes gracilis]|uniref:Inactive shikimate kinase like 1, chloroplastic n=1 Tax=Nepenthes gracilis TaxID=150966 RepID=A0AAD3TA11_NEPGR|nr:hypothetical protein Nepgr_027533 [Nepenthes gracilis]
MEISNQVFRFRHFHFLQPSLLVFPLSSSLVHLPIFSKTSCPPHRPLISVSSERGPFFPKPLTGPRLLSKNNVPVDLATEPVRADPSVEMKKKAVEISNDLKGTSIFLVGMDNAKKASVGKVIADVLRYYYFDSDSLVEEAASGESSDKSFRVRDEDGFREAETEVLKQLSSMGRLVVSAGNGAVQSATNLALLRHGVSIWIDVPLDMIAKSIIEEGNQSTVSKISTPESFSEVLTRLAMLYEENRDGYATADAMVSLQKVASNLGHNYDELDRVTPEDMALEVFNELGKLTRVKKMMEAAGRPF